MVHFVGIASLDSITSLVNDLELDTEGNGSCDEDRSRNDDANKARTIAWRFLDHKHLWPNNVANSVTDGGLGNRLLAYVAWHPMMSPWQ